jgi:hypothetical protein
MKLFAIGTFQESSKSVTLPGAELVELFRQKPQLVVLDDEVLCELESRAKEAALARIAQDDTLAHLRGFDPDRTAAQLLQDQLYAPFVALCDEELTRLFHDDFEPADDDRFIVASLDHDATFPITQVLERVTARDAIATH